MNREAADEASGQIPTAADGEALSALADGELTAADTASMVRRWASDETLRAQWQCHQVIGDALRSQELAGRGDEARFLAALRVRLADEPVVLAPAPLAPVSSPLADTSEATPRTVAPSRRRPRWAGGAAVAAGFAAVVGVLLSLNQPASDRDASGTVISAAPIAGPGSPVTVVPVEWAPGTAGTPRQPLPGTMIRDERIDAYLDAHRQLGPNSWMAIPTAATQLRGVPPSR